MTFEYIVEGEELPKPKQTYTNSDLNIAVPIILEFLSKMQTDATSGTPTVVIQFKLDANSDESDQEVGFLQRFQPLPNVAYKLMDDGSLFHHVMDRKTTPLDRVAYIVQST